MKWIRYVIFILCLTAYSTSDDIPSETNEIDPKEAVRKLDPAIRQALLRAIDNLEKRVAEEEDYEDAELAAGNDEGIDEDSKSGHDLLKSLLDIVSTERNLIGSLNSTSELSQLIEKSALRASNQQLTRVIPAEITNDISGSDQNSTTVTKRPYTATRRRTTTEATTTTTKKAPTHNADGENIEVVEKQDIKIFQAPLITAFTVKHDEKGTEKEVIPIFEPPPLPQQAPILPSQSILAGPAIDSTNKQATSVLLPTPNPSQHFPTNQQGPSQEVAEHIRKNQSLPTAEKIPFNPSQSVFNERQALPLSPVNPSRPNTINEFLLERQRQLEQQILQLQIQARRQQEQILLQQQLLLDQQRKQFLNSDSTNQIIPGKTPKVDAAVRPSLEVVPSVTQPPRFEYSVEQQLPVREAANFRQDFIGPITGLQRTSFQIQPSNQIPFNPSNSQFSQSSPAVPLEVATFQHLPQRSFQPFNLLPPSGPQNPNHSIGKNQQPDHSSQRTRHFRQESGTGNFFIHEPLRPPPFGAASTFNFNPFPLQNLHFNGQFGGNF